MKKEALEKGMVDGHWEINTARYLGYKKVFFNYKSALRPIHFTNLRLLPIEASIMWILMIVCE